MVFSEMSASCIPGASIRMNQPTLVYTSYTYEQRVVLTTRWANIFDARVAIKGALKHFAAHGLPCRVWHYGEEIWSGEYKVELLFGPNTDHERVIRAALTKPPYSNRGVTK